MTVALAQREQPRDGALAMWDAEQIDIIKRLICPDATDTELALFGQVCQRTGLDPFAKQIYGIKRKGRLTIQTGIDGFRLQAQRSRDYAGQEGPQWAGEDGVWRDVWLSKELPSAARVGVYRRGWTRPVWGVATWAEYAQTFNGQPADMWQRMPANMLAKCAEAQALRKAFPAELSGLYAKEEMDQAENPTPVRGEVIDEISLPPSGWTDAMQARWAAGESQAREIGAAIPVMPPEDAPRLQIVAALRTMGDNIVARRQLLSDLKDAVKEVQDLGGSYDMPDDLPLIPDAEIRELIEHARLAARPGEAVPA